MPFACYLTLSLTRLRNVYSVSPSKVQLAYKNCSHQLRVEEPHKLPSNSFIAPSNIDRNLLDIEQGLRDLPGLLL